MTLTEVVVAPSTVLVDSRNTCLRATFHPTDRLVVLSHWRDGSCTSTFQLASSDVARLTTFLVGVLGESVTPTEAVRNAPVTMSDRIRRRVAALGRRFHR
jgi:hypothetical protein